MANKEEDPNFIDVAALKKSHYSTDLWGQRSKDTCTPELVAVDCAREKRLAVSEEDEEVRDCLSLAKTPPELDAEED